MTKTTLNSIFLSLFTTVFVLFSCQTSENELIEEPVDENTALTAALRTSLQNIATLDGSFDNILDGASCIEVVLPITVIVDGLEIIVDNVEDFETIEAIFDEFEDDEDLLEILFPITIILQDFTEVIIDSPEELESFTSLCDGENEIDDDIECIDIQYPISFSVFDVENNASDTITVNSDEALFLFLDSLTDDTIVSINFPVTLIGADGNTIVVNNPEELENAIDEAIDDCDEDDDTDFDDDDEDPDLETLEEILLECYWEIIPNNSPNFDDFLFHFEEDGTLIGENEVTGESFNGSWEILENNEDDLILIIDFPLMDINGSWEIIDLEDDRIELEEGANTLLMEQDCMDDNDLSEEEVDETLLECVWVGIPDGSDDFTFFELRFLDGNVLEARNTNLNEITIGSWSTSTNNEDDIVVVIELSGDAMVFDGNWIIEEFEEDRIEFIDGNRTLVIEQDCEDDADNEEDLEILNTSLMECVWIGVPNGSDNFNFYDLRFNENGLLEAENTNDGTILSGSWETFFNNEDDFILIIDLSGDAAVFNGNWFILEFEEDRIELADGDNTLILEQDCSDGNNGNDDLNAFNENLMECEWIIIPNGSPNFEIYRFEFQDNGVFIGEDINSGEVLEGTWETFLNDDEDVVLIIDFPLAPIEGEWVVIDFEEDRIEFVNGNNILVMEKEC